MASEKKNALNTTFYRSSHNLNGVILNGFQPAKYQNVAASTVGRINAPICSWNDDDDIDDVWNNRDVAGSCSGNRDASGAMDRQRPVPSNEKPINGGATALSTRSTRYNGQPLRYRNTMRPNNNGNNGQRWSNDRKHQSSKTAFETVRPMRTQRGTTGQSLLHIN